VLTYFTAQVKDGKLVYTDDFYGWDKAAPRWASAAPGNIAR
jgi:murein L,D-transpeptidase YcbB/YkuD